MQQLEQGSFWGLQRALQEGTPPRLGCITCCELGFELDRLLYPFLPTWVIQNAAGMCSELSPLLPQVEEFLILTHTNCSFLDDCSWEEHLERQLTLLEGAPLASIPEGSAKVHPWVLRDGHLAVYIRESKRHLSPIQLSRD